MGEILNLSLILPIKNGAQFIDSSFAAIKDIALPADEILIINDGSTDGTEQKLQRIQKADSRVHVFSSGGIGLVGSLNLGLSLANNEYAARFDVDDRYSSDRLIQQREALITRPVAVFSDYECWNHNFSKSLGSITSAVNPECTYLSLISSSRTPHPSVVLNVRAAKEVGGYLPEDFLAEDLSLWLRMASIGKIISIPKILLDYRIGRGSVTSSNQVQMSLKRNAVLNRYRIPSSIHESVIENLDIIFNEYDVYEKPERRKLLLLRDLLHYEKIYCSISTAITKVFIKSVMDNFQSFSQEYASLALEKYRRQRNR